MRITSIKLLPASTLFPKGVLAVVFASLCCVVAAAQEYSGVKAPFHYLRAKAYHVLPETHNHESGYSSLVEGLDGKIYVGTAKYGENAYLVEFNPRTEKQRIVLDTNKTIGATGRGYAAQAKIHTKNFVGPSGKVYVGSKQGYPLQDEKAANDIPAYPGGYVMTYDPKTDSTENLGMPWPGQGVGDVVADESRGLIYVVTCEDEYWMVYDVKTKKYRWLGPTLFEYASTIVDPQGRASAITKDFQIARFDPATNQLSVQPIIVDGKKLGPPEAGSSWIPRWRLTPDSKSAYLIRLGYPQLFKLDLSGALDKPVDATLIGRMLDAEKTDCRSGISVAPDGTVYVTLATRNTTGFGKGSVNHLTRYTPESGKIEDLGVLTVANPGFFNFKPDAADKKPPYSHGYQTLPDGMLTPQFAHLGSIVARDGSVYAMILYPFTLLRLSPEEIGKAPGRPVPQTTTTSPT